MLCGNNLKKCFHFDIKVLNSDHGGLELIDDVLAP